MQMCCAFQSIPVPHNGEITGTRDVRRYDGSLALAISNSYRRGWSIQHTRRHAGAGASVSGGKRGVSRGIPELCAGRVCSGIRKSTNAGTYLSTVGWVVVARMCVHTRGDGCREMPQPGRWVCRRAHMRACARRQMPGHASVLVADSPSYVCADIRKMPDKGRWVWLACRFVALRMRGHAQGGG